MSLPLSSAFAQTAPPWLRARTATSGTQYTFSALALDAAGNTYQAGSFLGTVVVGGTSLTSRGDTDVYLAKYNPTGTLLWVRQIGSSGSEITYDLALDAAGNAYVAGNFTGSTVVLGNNVTLISSGSSQAFVVRYSAQGTPEWAQQSTTGATASSIGTDTAGNVYVVGTYFEALSLGTAILAAQGSTPAYLAQLSAATGAVRRLTQAYGYQPGGASYQDPRLATTPTGAVYVLVGFSRMLLLNATTLNPTAGSDDVMVARFDAQGGLEWVRQYGGPANDGVMDGVADAAGNLHLVGSFTGPATFGTISLPGAGGRDGYLARISPQGSVQWIQPMGGTGIDTWAGVSLDAGGNVYVTGAFQGTARFGSVPLTSAGSADIAVAAYSPQGQLRMLQQAGGTSSDVGTALGVGPTGEVHVFGHYSGTCSFGPFLLTAVSSQDTFLGHLGSTVTATQDARPQRLSLYPNPATDAVHLPTLPAGTRVQLVDALGRVATVSAAAQVSVRGLTPGLYTLCATNAQGQPYHGRVVVE